MQIQNAHKKDVFKFVTKLKYIILLEHDKKLMLNSLKI